MLLHLLLELDVRRAPTPPPIKALLSPEHGWLPVIDRAALAPAATPEAAADAGAASQPEQESEEAASTVSQEQNSPHAATNGKHAEAQDASDQGDSGSKPCSSAVDAAEERPPGREGVEGEQGQRGAVKAQDGGSSGKGAGGVGGASGKQAETGNDGTLPLLQCGLEDVTALAAHWDRHALSRRMHNDEGVVCVHAGCHRRTHCPLRQMIVAVLCRFPEGWRSSIRGSCDVLRTAIVKSGLYQSGSLQQFLVRAALCLSNLINDNKLS